MTRSTRWLPLIAVLSLIALCFATRASSADPSHGSVVAAEIVATWQCQDTLHPDAPVAQRRTAARYPWKPHTARYWVREKNLWTVRHRRCDARLQARKEALRTGRFDRLPTADLYELAGQAIAHGGVYSVAWGGASPILKALCYEAVRRTFARYGTERWALHVVNRESGCNPGAVNTTYSDPGERATCISQMIPNIHTWVDYGRCQRDLRYAVEVFVRLSQGGQATGPWSG